MRRGCLAVAGVLLLLAGVVAAVLATGYYADLPRVSLKTDQRLLAIAARVPADVDQAIVAPAFGPAVRELAKHPITRDAVYKSDDASRVKLLGALVGPAPFAAWSEDDQPRLLIEIGGWRRSLLLAAARFAAVDLTTHDRWVAVGGVPATAGGAIDASVAGEGHLFALHRAGGDRYPPVGRPAITAVTLSGSEMRALSGARATEGAPPRIDAVFEHPNSALLTIAFWQPHAALRDLDRFLPVDLQRLAVRGASLVLYDIETRGLLPRPKGLIALPETKESIDAAASLFNAAAFEQLGDGAVTSRSVGGVRIDRGKRLGATIEVARAHGRVYIGFDGGSLEQYLTGSRTALTPNEGGHWSIRADANRLRPVVDELADHKGLRFVASRVNRSARQMRSLLRMLPNAATVAGDKYVAGGLEQVDLTVTSK